MDAQLRVQGFKTRMVSTLDQLAVLAEAGLYDRRAQGPKLLISFNLLSDDLL
jgi:hypothetical protein